MAPPRPGRQGTSVTFLQFLQTSFTVIALALVLEAAIVIPDILTNFDIYCAYNIRIKKSLQFRFLEIEVSTH